MLTGRCHARGCARLWTSRVKVGWRILSDEVVRHERGMAARLSAVACLCPGHEQEVAEGGVVAISRRVVIREVAP